VNNNDRRLDKNVLLKKFNIEELKEYLNQIIDAEIKKPLSEMDTDLIGECVDFMLEIEEQKIMIPEYKIKEITKSIIEKHYKPKRKIFNVIRIVSACVIIILSIQIVSMTVFHENLFKDVYDEAKYIIYHVTHSDDKNVT